MRVNDQLLESSTPRSFKFLFAWSNLVGIGWWSINTATGGYMNSAGWPPGSKIVAMLFVAAWLAAVTKPRQRLGFLLGPGLIAAALIFTSVVILKTLPWLENPSQPENLGVLFGIGYWIVAIPPAIAALCYAFALHRIWREHH